jgi:hypothetical protein
MEGALPEAIQRDRNEVRGEWSARRADQLIIGCVAPDRMTEQE